MGTMKVAANTPLNLLRASEAAGNWRAVVMTCVSGAVTVALMMLAGSVAMRSVALGGLIGLVALVAGIIGYSAVGLILMRQAGGQHITLGDALLQSVFTVHRLFGVGLLLCLIYLGLILVALVILYICRIPAVGELLFALAYPVLGLVLGVATVGLFMVAFPLAAPAVWQGHTVFGTIARLLVIVRTRLLMVMVNLLVLGVLVAVLSGLATFVLVIGNASASGLASAVGIQSFSGLWLQALSAGNYGGGGDSYGTALRFGMAFLFMLGAIIPFLTFINGNCLIFLQAEQGLEFDAAEDKLRAGVDEARRRAQEAKGRVQAQLDESRLQAAPVAAAPARSCTQCATPLGAEDRFCGECGSQNPV